MKLVDMNDSKSFGLYHVGSSPTSGTIEIIADTAVLAFFYKYVYKCTMFYTITLVIGQLNWITSTSLLLHHMTVIFVVFWFNRLFFKVVWKCDLNMILLG